MSLTPRLDKIQKNYIINGDMRIAQRGTSFAAITNGAYHLDRWRYSKSGAMVHTVSQGTDVPSMVQADYLFQNSMVATLTTPDTSIAAGDLCTLGQKIEGYNWAHIAQKRFTFSFWVKATLPGTYCVAFLSSNGDRSYVAEYAINATNTWEYKSIIVEASPAGGTWNYTNGAGLEVVWTLAAGTTYQTTANAWQTGTYFATANQINGVDTGATSWLVTGVSIYEGELDSPKFSTFAKDAQAELAACQRYYEKSYDITTVPDTLTPTGVEQYLTVGNNAEQHSWGFRIAKRAAPSMAFKDPVTGTAGQVDRARNVTDGVQVFLLPENTGQKGFGSQTAAASGKLIRFHWTADAEL